MKRIEPKFRITVLALAILCPALAIAAPQVPPSAPVTVVNTTSNPVPVSLQGQVSGSVKISNPSLAVDALNDTLNEPYVENHSFAFGPTTRLQLDFDIPDGKRLIVETLTVRSALTEAKGVTAQYAIVKRVDSSLLSLGGDLSMTPAQAPIDGMYWTVGTHPVKLRIDAVPGLTNELVAFLNCSGCSGTWNVSVAGYLVPLPQ